MGDYRQYFGDVKIPELLASLKKSDMGYTDCTDPTVGRYNAYYRGATSIVEKRDGGYVKKQEGYMEYDLIENEYRLLKNLESNHFPEVWREGDDIVIEDCGDRLTIANLPDDWKFQLVHILSDLKTNKVIHRDIKPNNLMVKSDTIMLIDFGWAKLESEKDNPPSCLGMPYRPSWGWDDRFSMKKVIKEIEYKLGDLNG